MSSESINFNSRTAFIPTTDVVYVSTLNGQGAGGTNGAIYVTNTDLENSLTLLYTDENGNLHQATANQVQDGSWDDLGLKYYTPGVPGTGSSYDPGGIKKGFFFASDGTVKLRAVFEQGYFASQSNEPVIQDYSLYYKPQDSSAPVPVRWMTPPAKATQKFSKPIDIASLQNKDVAEAALIVFGARIDTCRRVLSELQNSLSTINSELQSINEQLAGVNDLKKKDPDNQDVTNLYEKLSNQYKTVQSEQQRLNVLLQDMTSTLGSASDMCTSLIASVAQRSKGPIDGISAQ